MSGARAGAEARGAAEMLPKRFGLTSLACFPSNPSYIGNILAIVRQSQLVELEQQRGSAHVPATLKFDHMRPRG